jgi:phosphatidylethanolamine-binding protein (PEBP) family uncharacterized protein
MNVSFAHPISNQDTVPLNDMDEPPTVTFPGVLNHYYTVVMYDRDAPYPPPNNINAPFIHWLVINIPGNDLEQGNSVLPYLPPNPPSSDPHRYQLDLYRQLRQLPDSFNVSRHRFPLDKWINRNGLILLDTMNFLSHLPR